MGHWRRPRCRGRATAILGGPRSPIRGNPGYECAILIEAFAGQYYAVVGNLVFADVLAVAAVAHFDDGHDTVENAIEVQITQPNDVVGQK
jgi:hypothetical protein